MFRKIIALTSLALLISSCQAKKMASDSSSNTAPLALTKEQVQFEKEKEAKVVYFDYNSSKLTTDSSNFLDTKVIPVLKENTKTYITIEGHCDERGTRNYNYTLGNKRAKEVRTYLTQNGISKSRIKTRSYGEDRPVSAGHDEESWAKNRRAVTITIK